MRITSGPAARFLLLSLARVEALLAVWPTASIDSRLWATPLIRGGDSGHRDVAGGATGAGGSRGRAARVAARRRATGPGAQDMARQSTAEPGSAGTGGGAGAGGRR